MKDYWKNWYAMHPDADTIKAYGIVILATIMGCLFLIGTATGWRWVM